MRHHPSTEARGFSMIQPPLCGSRFIYSPISFRKAAGSLADHWLLSLICSDHWKIDSHSLSSRIERLKHMMGQSSLRCTTPWSKVSPTTALLNYREIHYSRDTAQLRPRSRRLRVLEQRVNALNAFASRQKEGSRSEQASFHCSHYIP